METTHNYEPGEVVKVFSDPVTKQVYEDYAKIVQIRQTAHYYDVEFVTEPGVIYSRFIY